MRLQLKPVSSKKALTALEAVKETIDFEKKKGMGLSEKEDKIRRFILEAFPRIERAPSAKEIGEALGIKTATVEKTLEKLDSFDIIYLRPGTHEISGAYPFSNGNTAHIVTIKNGSERKANAMCAIDALGVPFMFNADTSIDSSCAYCGKDIHIEIKNGAVAVQNPKDTVVWVGTTRCGPAATSICTTLLFLCSNRHLEKWRKNHPGEGMILSVPEALYVGKGIFEDFLK